MLQELFVHARLVIETVEVRPGIELDEILIACLVFGEQQQVAVIFVADVTAQVAVGSDIDLTANDGLDTRFLRRLVKLDDPVHHAVVANGEAIHTQLFRPCHQSGDTAHPVQQAIFRMDMKMGKHRRQNELLIIAQGW